MVCHESKSSMEQQVKEIVCVLPWLLKSIILSLYKLLFKH